MYLGIFVIAAFSCIGVLRCEEAAPFMCPSCLETEENRVSECDAKMNNHRCTDQTDPVCVAAMGNGITMRTCMTRERYRYWYEKTAKDCPMSECSITMCDTSGCKAEFPTSVASFTCPFCFAEGENAVRDCDAYLVYLECPDEEDSVCTAQTESSGVVKRGCATRAEYNKLKKECETKGPSHCTIAMCEKSSCKAEFHISA